MKNKNNLKLRSLVVVFLGLVVILSFCCTNKVQSKNNSKREIIVYSHCFSGDASSDILYSIDQIKDHLTKKHVQVKIDKQKKKCGYLFINGNKTKIITSSLTDIDLLQEVNKFYGN